MYHMRKRVATFFMTSFKVKAFTRLNLFRRILSYLEVKCKMRTMLVSLQWPNEG